MGRSWINGDIVMFLIPIVAIASWALLAIVSTIARTRVRELEVRERIAMIEKGLVPPPEVDPRGFDREMAREHRGRRLQGYPGEAKYRRAGVTLTFVGLGLMVMLFPNFRVGGFIFVLGIGFLVNSLLFERTPPQPPASS
jgi:hypothetical protein